MMRSSKSWFGLAVILILLICLMPVGVMAEEANDSESTILQQNKLSDSSDTINALVGSFANGAIADRAETRAEGVYAGWCKVFVNDVVREASNGSINLYGYQQVFDNFGDEISSENAVRGDIIQITPAGSNDSTAESLWSFNDKSRQLHTAIILTNNGGGNFTVIDSNSSGYPMKVHRHAFNPYTSCAGSIIKIWRLGTAVPADTTPPTISNILITDIDAEGFTVHCNVSDNVGVTRVNYATWTDANGQDELNFVDGVLSGGGSAFRVLYRDHKNERGSYKVDIRAYDAAGNCAGPITTGTTIDSTPPTITDAEILNRTPLGYTVKCKVADESGIDRVQFPTWTSANGQDDIQPTWWGNSTASGKIEGDTVTYQVNDVDHNFERGEYNTHIYAYDKFGNFTSVGLITTVENNGSIVSEETLNNHRYILLDDILNWKEAEAKAEELGGTLVTISSQDEQSLVERLIKLGQRYQYFIGGTDESQEGTFRWVTGDLIGLAKWGSGEPNNAGGSENYLQIGKTGFWNDIPVTSLSSGYIVEIDRDKLQIADFKASDDTGSYTNRDVGLTADISGGVAPVQYKFYYKLGDTSNIIQDYAETNTASFKPTLAGTYTLFVDAKDSEGRTATKSISNYVVQKNIGITYQTQIQNIGWQEQMSNGTMSGTSGQSLRLEGIKINLDNQGYDIGVSYQTHIENIGWEEDTDRGWKSDGVMSGTEGLCYRLEAIQIKLTGADADKFDVYYQVHAQNFGWLDWTKNGESAGTAGLGYRLEAINIVVVPKDAVAPGTTDRPFVQK